MRSTRPLRPAHPVRRHTLATASVAAGAVLGIITMTGLTTASASADVGSSTSDSLISTTVTIPSADAPARAETLREITAQAKATLAEAQSALVAAHSVSADIAASRLDIGTPATTVDTTALRAQIDRLSNLDVLPLLFLPGVTDGAATETKSVAAQTATLRTHLDAAKAKKAAADAAAKAKKAAADAAAKAKRDAEAAAAAVAAANTPAGAQAVARQIASADYGWGDGQFSCLQSLWNRESGWNYQAYNGSSGAAGIPQALPGSKMASVGSDWQTNAVTQIRWGLKYIAGAYGSPCGAWSHSQATNWY
ncbi:phospholipase [Microbacterium deminutum]|uniref:Phospholipase n=1 Tax=Microbacterium deminutum TaxID=344164 RepID=A0ABN2QZH3_9MICO